MEKMKVESAQGTRWGREERVLWLRDLVDGVFDLTGGRGLHALHLADGYGGMRASASVNRN